MNPDEKLDLLHWSLKGDARYRVSGLGGGETTYKQALQGLQKAYGRGGMKRASLRAGLKLLPDDPAKFQRFADRVHTYLFDLSRIQETASQDIVDSICNGLQKADHLA